MQGLENILGFVNLRWSKFFFHILNNQPYRFEDCHVGLDIATERPVLICRPWDLF